MRRKSPATMMMHYTHQASQDRIWKKRRMSFLFKTKVHATEQMKYLSPFLLLVELNTSQTGRRFLTHSNRFDLIITLLSVNMPHSLTRIFALLSARLQTRICNYSRKKKKKTSLRYILSFVVFFF